MLSGPAVERLANAPIREVVLTNTLPIPGEKQFDNLTVLSIAPTVAKALDAVFADTSVSKHLPRRQRLTRRHAATVRGPRACRSRCSAPGARSPIRDRAGPATLVRAAGRTLLVDCGRGVLMRLAAAGVLPPMFDAVLVTHLHSDHLTDLNDVITTHWVMNPQPVALSVFGPPGMREVVDATLAALAPDIRYRLAHHADLTEPPSVEVTEVTPGDSFDVGAAAVRVAATDHRPVEPTVGYRFESDGRSGRSVVTACPAPGSTSCARAPTRTCRR